MKFREISIQEFADFSITAQQKNFFQTPMMYQRLKNEGAEVYLLGVEMAKKIIAATLVVKSNVFLGKKTFSAYKGYLLDYEDDQVLIFFSTKIKAFLRQKGGYKLVIDPYLPNVSRDSEANIIPGVDNQHIKTKLINLNYQYLGETGQVKWTYCLDLKGKTKEQLFDEMRPSTRNYINRTVAKYQLNIRTLTYDELDQFKKITVDTCARRSFDDKSLTYYQDMYKTFGKQVVFKICELDIKKYRAVLELENVNYQTKLAELSDSSSNKNKKINMQKEIINNENKIIQLDELSAKNGNIITLAGAMFILYGDEVVYLFSGSYEEYMSYCGQYALQWDIIQIALEEGYQRYNFYGIKDVFDKKGPDYGVYDFKKGFGGYVEELLGSFETGLCFQYKIYRFFKRIKHLIKK